MLLESLVMSTRGLCGMEPCCWLVGVLRFDVYPVVIDGFKVAKLWFFVNPYRT
jgi:hypothetical protein